MLMNWNEFLITCHNYIRAGATDKAAVLLKQINTAQIPREHALEAAALCRRSGLISQGLRILKPIVVGNINSDLSKTSAKPSEIGEYSILLFKNGSIKEALLWLNEVKIHQISDSFLYLGFSHIMQWNYKDATTCLEKYISSAPESFMSLVAKVNLASAYVHTNEFEKAEHQIRLNLEEAIKYQNKRLQANSYEMLGQLLIRKSDYSKAKKQLEHAWEILKNDNSNDQLFVIKWKSIIESLESGDIDSILQAKAVAAQRRHWETFRDLDFYHIKVDFNFEIFKKLYCGTPFTAYRERLKKEFAQAGEMPSTCLIGNSGPVLNVRTSQLREGGAVSLPSTMVQNVFQNLWKDLYRPQSVGSLFENVFQQEYFDPDTSPNRIHRLILRARHWLKENYIPMKINFVDKGFKPEIIGDVQLEIEIDQGEKIEISNLGHLTKWKRAESFLKSTQFFSAEDVSTILNQSHSSSNRLLAWALEECLVTKSGRGKSTRYQINKEKPAQVA